MPQLQPFCPASSDAHAAVPRALTHSRSRAPRGAVLALAVAAAAIVAGCAGRLSAPAGPPLQPAHDAVLPTVADAKARADVLASIGVFESTAGGSATPRLVAVEQLGNAGGSWVERWLVDSNGNRVAYSVKLWRDHGGAIDFSIERLLDASHR